MPVLPSYRKQSINLYRKPIDWFLYESNTSIFWVKKKKNYEKFASVYKKLI